MMIFINGTTARRDAMIDQPRSADTQTPHACRIVRKNGRRIVDCNCDILRTTAYNPAAQPSRPWGTLPNWHVTWAGSASSDGAAPGAEPGQYPADEDGNSADSVVAPGVFVTAYCRENDPHGHYPNTPADAVRAWARQQGFYCA
jgi:hypothetical protein